jgi:hypothetical protein
MRVSLRLAAAAAAMAVLLGTACKKNSAPEAPTVQGTTRARPADTLSYRFSSTDPDGDSVSFLVLWGDGASSQWSTTTASGEEHVQTHVYPDSGVFYIRAMARDGQEAESGWSDSLQVRIGSYPPETPSQPTGPVSCSTGLAYTWRAKAVHPLHDSVSIQFSWGNGDTSSWGTFVASNESYEEVHTYSLPGLFRVTARARDAWGLESGWSETLLVRMDSVSTIPQGAPRNLVLSAATDSTVRVAWSAPTDTAFHPSRYVVLFKEVGATNYDSVGGAPADSFVHDPLGRTGTYKVAAVYDSSKVNSSESPSTIPIGNSLQWVPELSVAGVNTGYGWSRTTGQAFLYDMTTLDSFAKVDFYISDFAAGYTGPGYLAASPDTAPDDPGGAVPSGAWHITEFSHLDSAATEQSALPRYTASRYDKVGVLDSLPRLVACYTTEDQHYALIRVSDARPATGEVYLETWFQLIKGLRLIEHF